MATMLLCLPSVQGVWREPWLEAGSIDVPETFSPFVLGKPWWQFDGINRGMATLNRDICFVDTPENVHKLPIRSQYPGQHGLVSVTCCFQHSPNL
jgi:hypothetical protein